MSSASKQQLPFREWPNDDRHRWEAVFKPGDLFDDTNRGAHLAPSTREALRVSYARYLRFIAEHHHGLLERPPEVRLNRELIAEYVSRLRRTNQESSVVTTLRHLRLALRLICPDVDWAWLLTITKRIAAAAPRRARKHPTVTSERLYLLGIELIDRAVATGCKDGEISKLAAMEYRDGLLIALLALFLPRRRTVTAIQIGKQLVRAGELWALEIPPEDTKNKQALDFSISADMSRRIDVFLQDFRVHLPGADRHNGLWASNKRRPMSHSAIYDAVRRRTKKAFGFAVNLHQFRHAAGCFWSIQDPVNVRGVKDLLGHASFEKTTEKHYMMGQSRLAGRALAKAIDTRGPGCQLNGVGEAAQSISEGRPSSIFAPG
jgi:integrase/recombinase XerD